MKVSCCYFVALVLLVLLRVARCCDNLFEDYYTRALEIREKAMETPTFEDDLSYEPSLKRQKAGLPARYQNSNEAKTDSK